MPAPVPGFPRAGERRVFGNQAYVLTNASVGWGGGGPGEVTLVYRSEREWLAGQMVPDERPRMARWKDRAGRGLRRCKLPAWVVLVFAAGAEFGFCALAGGNVSFVVAIVADLAAIPFAVWAHWFRVGWRAR